MMPVSEADVNPGHESRAILRPYDLQVKQIALIDQRLRRWLSGCTLIVG